ncbi:MAG: hypothetical protein R2695_12200 [Acidimicrobiales bacterium]
MGTALGIIRGSSSATTVGGGLFELLWGSSWRWAAVAAIVAVALLRRLRRFRPISQVAYRRSKTPLRSDQHPLDLVEPADHQVVGIGAAAGRQLSGAVATSATTVVSEEIGGVGVHGPQSGAECRGRRRRGPVAWSGAPESTFAA